MVERRDYRALEWVAGEIEESLREAGQAFAAWLEQREDATKLRFCLSHVHQVAGSLRMVEFSAPALLAEALERCAQALLEGAVPAPLRDDAARALQAGLTGLEQYVVSLKAERQEHPAQLMVQINDLRAVIQRPLVSETVLFRPQLPVPAETAAPAPMSGTELLDVAGKLRQMYQIALTQLLRGEDPRKNLNYLAKVAARLVKLSAGGAQETLWKVLIGVCEGLLNRAIHLGPALNVLLRQVDGQLKTLVERGDAALVEPPPPLLLQNLLFYVAASRADSRFIRELRETYQLDQAIALDTQNPGARAALAEQLRTLAIQAEAPPADWLRVADALALLDQGRMLVEFRELALRRRRGQSVPEEALEQMALAVSDQTEPREAKPLFNDSEEAQQQLDSAFEAVMRESRNALEQAKEAIVEFVASQWRHESLEDVPRLLAEVRGSLAVAGMSRAANVLLACERYVAEELLEQRQVPDWQLLDTLADAITSIDYYLERREEQEPEISETVLDVAERSVARLQQPESAESAANTEASPLQRPTAQVIPFQFPAAGNTQQFVDDEDEEAAEAVADASDVPGDAAGQDAVSDAVDTDEENPSADAESEAPWLTADDESSPAFTVEASTEEEPQIGEAAGEAEAADSADDEDDDVDPEIAEIFIEEAGEVLEALDELLPGWQVQPSASEALNEVRRAFHTLKGSGRMVGAMAIGELAWSVENMLNRVLDGSLAIDPERVETVVEARELVPSMVDQFAGRGDYERAAVSSLIERAEALSKAQSVELTDSDGADPADSEDAVAETVADAADNVVSSESEITADNDEPLSDWLPENDVPETEPVATLDDEQPATTDVAEPIADSSAVADSSGPEESTVADSSEETDAVLLDIFAGEAVTHLRVLEDFLFSAADSDEPGFSDDLQRALHTLKGSAHMAGVTPIAAVVTPIENLVKELRSVQSPLDADVLLLLTEAIQLIRRGLAQLESDPLRPLAGADDFVERVRHLTEERLAAQEEAQASAGETPSPELFNRFLADAVEMVSAVGEDLQRWREQNLEDQRQYTLAATMSMVADNAGSLNQPVIEELAQSLQTLLRLGAEQEQLPPAEFFELCHQAVERLIDMLDCLAAQQNPRSDDALLAELQDFEFSAPIETSVEREEWSHAPAEALSLEALPDSDDASSEAWDGGQPVTREFEATDDNLSQAEPVSREGSADTGGGQAQDSAADSEAGSGWQAEFESTEIETDDNQENTGGVGPFVIENAAVESSAEEFESAVSDHIIPDEPASGAYSPESENDLAPVSDKNENASELFAMPVVQSAEDVMADEEDDEPSAFSSGDDEVDAEILEIFLEEADDLLEAIDEAVHGWQVTPEDTAFQDDLQRLLHTLKGGARLAGLTALGNLSHNFETLLINAQSQGREPDAALLSEVQAYQDQLVAGVEAVKTGGRAAQPVVEAETDEATELTEALSPTAAETVDSAEPFSQPEPIRTESDAVIVPFNRSPERSEAVPFTVPSARGSDVTERSGPSLRKGPQEVIKVPSQLLEDLVNLAGETSISRARSEEQVSELVFALDEMQITVERLQEQVRRLDLETEAQILFRQEQVENEGLEGFDPLEFDRYSMLQQLSRSLLESSSDLIDLKNTMSDKSRDMEQLLVQQSRINTELQEGLMRSRMVPFSRMVPRLRRIVRQVAGELGKEVEFLIDNAEGELDRTVLEKIVAPLEHMLRNAVDHGIEDVEQRHRSGKPKAGTIALSLAREGGEVVLRLADDGGGIDLEAVRRKAIERGLMDASAHLSDHEVLQFILQAGFSTAKKVTQISGRGVGMDVVHSEIKQLGGSVEIDSRYGEGTQFTVRLPFTVSVNRALMVHVAGDTYAIPLNTIEGIVRVSPFELEAYYQPDAPPFEYAGQEYLMRYLGALLRTSERPNLEGQVMPLPVILVRGSDHAVAVQVDGLLGSREIVVKSLGPQFALVQGLSGATVLGDGSVVVILDLLAMIRADASHLHRDYVLGEDERRLAEQQRPLSVMVVDDSVTVRKVTSRFLERQGMEVVLAKDGMDAITQLQEIERVPDIMLLDIEMPRMDGYEVASRIRHTSRLQEMPIIMITSRTGEKHRERALSLGVNRYLGKPYQESVLLESIFELTGREPEPLLE